MGARVVTTRGLHADLRIVRGAFELSAALRVDPGEVVAVLGPNGSGKSTMLAALAGLLPPVDGRVVLDGLMLDDASAGRHIEPPDRSVGVMFQDYLLFPHLTAVANVAFGLRARGVPKAVALERAGAWLARMGLADMAGRRPRQLSGGQAQRVALARALVTEPRLLLLDEPLAALDAGTRAAVRQDLRRHLSAYDGCTLLVTHDAIEAMVLGDRIVVLEAGRVVQEGTPSDVARHPRTEYVASLVGLNLLRGTARDHEVAVGSGGSVVLGHAATGEVLVAFRPSAVTLHREPPEGSARNVWAGTVSEVEAHGDVVRVAVDGQVSLLADVTPYAVADLRLAPGEPVWATVKATEVTAYPA